MPEGLKFEGAPSPEQREKPVHQIFRAETVYGTDQGTIHNAIIVVGPDGNIEQIYSGEDGQRELAERSANEEGFQTKEHQAEVIMPAITDAHNHPMMFPEILEVFAPAYVFGISDEQTLAHRLKESLSHKVGTQLAIGWDTSSIPDVTRSKLDEVRRDATYLMDMSYHGAVANTEGLRKIDEFLEKTGLKGRLKGHIDYNTGKLYEQYALLGLEIMELEIDPQRIVSATEDYLKNLRNAGTLFTHDMLITSPVQYEVYRNLSPEAHDSIRLAHISPRMANWAQSKGEDVSDMGFKLFADGANQSRSSLHYEPFLGTNNTGIEYHTLEDAQEAMKVALELDMRRLATHGIGNRGIDHAILFSDVWKQLLRDRGLDGNARIEHMSLPNPDSLRRAGASELWVSPQPNFIPDVIPFGDRFSQEKLAGMVPIRRMIDSGMRVMIGTDGMPNSMLLAMHCAIDAPNESQKLSLEEAVHYSTATAAQYEGANRGKIKVGMPADFLITTHQLEEKLSGSKYGIYQNTPETMAKLNEDMYEGTIHNDLASEVVDVHRAGQSVIEKNNDHAV